MSGLGSGPDAAEVLVFQLPPSLLSVDALTLELVDGARAPSVPARLELALPDLL